VDANRFDVLARSLEDGSTRRVALSGALGAGFACLLSRFGAGEADAKKRKRKKKKCKGGKKNCGKTCILKTGCCGGCGAQRCCGGICAGCCNDTDCENGEACFDGTCVCPAENAVCDGICVDLAADGANCGSCGNTCDTGECIHGACTCSGDFDCPGDCTCSSRKQGAPNGCRGPGTGAVCDVDTKCPLGSICRLSDTCSIPCQG
jgi:hypothetical protein